MTTRRRRVARPLVLVGIVGMHGVLLLLLTGIRHGGQARTYTGERLQVRFVSVQPPAVPPRSAGAAPAPRTGRTPPGRPVDVAIAPAEPVGERAGSAPAPRIDWSRAAERVAAEAAAAPGAVPGCEPSGRPDSQLPPCPPRGKPFEWRPEPRAVEFSGGLPYVRVGKRCVVGLGFFGCGIGKLPEANGDLFDGMQNADRERSSVPDTPR